MADFIPQAPEGGTLAPSPKAPRTAVASLVLGLLSFIFSIFTGIAAVVCGHKALGKIKRSGGLMPGKGMAITGLVTGYLSIAAIPMIVGLAVPVIARFQENAQMTQVMTDAREVYLAAALYQGDNGTFPENLQQLVEGQYLESDASFSSASYPTLTYDGGAPEGQLFHYFQPEEGAAPDTVIMISDCSFAGSDSKVRRIVAMLDGSITIERFPKGEPVR